VALVTAPLASLTPITPRSRLLTIDMRGHALDFVAGQAVMVGTHGQPDRRPYSIACSPERVADTGVLELLIALEDSGALADNLAPATPGTLLDVEGPMGAFTFPEPPTSDWVLFVAGGTGIAPLRAMIDHVLRHHPDQQMALLYSARRSDEFAFIDELRGYARHGQMELHQTVTRDQSASWGGARGRIGRSHFETVLHDAARTVCFVCGPAPLVSESMTTLLALGVPEDQIRTEQWGK
jgi:ferredoxin-NADP reductase